MSNIQPEKLDDIQLSLYLAQKHYLNSNNPLIAMNAMKETADRMLQWIKEKRQEQTEENKKEIEERISGW